jgi:hypothetical protein
MPLDSYGDTNGGEFLESFANFAFTPARLAGTAAGLFETFCLEVNENIAFGGTYYADVSTSTLHGGVGGGSPDPLSPETAYLYGMFIAGDLAGYDYDVSGGPAARVASANALQHVIWYLEEEEGKTWTDGDGSKADVFYQDALANAGSDIGDVRVLNLYTDAAGTGFAQDHLVMIPEPGALWLVGLGVLALRRRAAA